MDEKQYPQLKKPTGHCLLGKNFTVDPDKTTDLVLKVVRYCSNERDIKTANSIRLRQKLYRLPPKSMFYETFN